uniref:G_PROTEIN_RECEP_F1_2 domain-containing protein n=1 Tax=Parastrongyloides trichosuri TaxID=131310 RepID=A0A0N4ZI61_PARTI
MTIYGSISNLIKQQNITLNGVEISSLGIIVCTKSSSVHIFMIIIFLLFLFTYATILIFYLKYKMYIKSHYDIMSTNTIKLNKYISKILLFQSITPLVIFGIPILIYYVTIFFEVQKILVYETSILLNIQTLTPTINALFYITMSKRNRDGLYNIVKITFKKVLCTKEKTQVQNINVCAKR